MKIVITGPESSGKSTLFKALEKHYNLNGVAEFARNFLSTTNGKYHMGDLLTIAKGQLNAELIKLEAADKFLLCDTDLLTIKIWSEYKFKSCADEIVNLLKAYPANLYILMSPDIPWEPDPLRENPSDRDQLLQIYEQELIELQIPYFLVSGDIASRLSRAIKIINNFLSLN